MRRFAVPAAISLAAVMLLIVLASGLLDSGPNNSIAYSVVSGHYRVPPEDHVQLPRLSGDAPATSTLATYRGKVVLVNYFASWCPPCQAEAPVLRQAQKILQAHGGTVLGIAFGESPSAALGYLEHYRLSYPAVTDPTGDVADAWGITTVPDSYLVDRQGKIVWLNTYQLTPGFLSRTLPQLLKQFA